MASQKKKKRYTSTHCVARAIYADNVRVVPEENEEQVLYNYGYDYGAGGRPAPSGSGDDDAARAEAAEMLRQQAIEKSRRAGTTATTAAMLAARNARLFDGGVPGTPATAPAPASRNAATPRPAATAAAPAVTTPPAARPAVTTPPAARPASTHAPAASPAPTAAATQTPTATQPQAKYQSTVPDEVWDRAFGFDQPRDPVVPVILDKNEEAGKKAAKAAQAAMSGAGAALGRSVRPMDAGKGTGSFAAGVPLARKLQMIAEREEADKQPGTWVNYSGTPVKTIPGNTIANPAWAKASPAEAPAAYGITPNQYIKHMQAIDAYNAWAENEQTSESGIHAFLQKWYPDIMAEGRTPTLDEINMPGDRVPEDRMEEFQADAMANYNSIMQMVETGEVGADPGEHGAVVRRDYDEAIAALGEDAPKLAGKTEAEYYEMYANQHGARKAGEAYRQSRIGTVSQDPNNPNRYTKAQMWFDQLTNRTNGTEANSMFTDGWTLLYQNMTTKERDTYYYLVEQYGQEMGLGYLEALMRDRGYNKQAYFQRETALKNMTRDNWAAATGMSILTAPMQTVGGLYGLKQALTGEEIDPFATDFMFGQWTQTPRAETGRMITQNFGDIDPTTGEARDNVVSWLMNRGYEAMTSMGDSAMSGMLSMGSPFLGSLGQGIWGAGGTMQDVTMRDGDTWQAMALAGAGVVLETATEYLPMDNWMKALDAGDIVSAGDIAKKALHGALSGGPGEGLSELGNELADQAIMGELSNWNTTVQAYRDGGMSEEAAKRMAALDVWERVGSATFTGMISEGATGAAAATRSYARNNAAANAVFANNAKMGPIDYRWGDDAETARPAAPEAPANDEYDIGLPLYDENGNLIPEEERRPWQPQTPMADPATLGEGATEQQEPQPTENEGVDAWKEETETGDNEEDDYDIGMPMYDENGNLIPEEERRPWQPEERAETEQQPEAAEEVQNAAESQQEGQQEAEQAEDGQEEGTEERRGETPENAENGHALDQRRDAAIVNGDGSVTQASVVGVESVSDGRVLMRMENADGETELVDAAELDFADESTQDLMSYEGLGRMNAQGVQGYLNNYDAQKAAPADYARAYNRIYQRAASGLDFNRAAGHDLAAMAYMTKAAKEAAYNAGRAVFQTRTDRYAKTEQTSAFQRTVLDALNKVTGGKIRMTDEDIGGNGYYDPKTGEIIISSKAEKGAYAYVAVHEMAHKMKAENAKAWGEFSRMVQDALKNNGVDIDAAMRHVQQLYQKQGVELDAEGALEEVICNSAASILQDADVVRDLVQRNRSVMERVADFLREWLDKLTGSLQKTGDEMSQLENWQQMKALKGDHAAMQKMYETLVGALEEVNEQESQQDVKMSAKEQNFVEDNVNKKFSLRETNENVQGVLRAQEAAIEQVKGHRITAMEADKLAGAMLKDGNSTYDRAELAQRIGATMDLLERGEGVSMEQIDDELNAIAEDVLAKSAVLDMEHEQRADPVRTYLKGTRIALTESQKQQAASMLGSYGNYRRALFGQAKLSQNGTPLDVVWSELSEMAPEWFPADASEGDMAALLLDGVNATKPVYQNMSGMTTEESAQWLAGQLMDHYLSLPGVRETAKNKKALGASVQEMRAALQSFEQAGEANFEKALRGIEAARKKAGDEAKIAEVAEMRRLWEEWKQERAAQGEERFQRKLAEYKGKLRRDDAAMRRLYVEVLQRGYRMQQQMDNETRKEREALRLQRGKLERTTRSLLTMLEKPTDTKHVPGPLMKPLQDVLDALDFSGKQTKMSVDLSARIEALADGMENSQEGDDPDAWQEGILLERDKQVIDELRRVAQLLAGNLQGHSREGRGVYDLNSQTLKELNKWLGVVHHCIVEAGKMHGSNLPQSVQETAEMSKAEMSRKKPLKDKSKLTKTWNQYFGADMMDSFSFFERLGPTANAVFHGLREGFDKNVQLIREAEKATREILSGLNLRELSGKHAKKQKFTLADGAEVELTKANVMELYVLSRRQQAMGHLLGEGIRVVGSEDVRSHKLTQGIIAQIVGTLTAEERIAAEKMQEFLAQKCGAWGNKASRVLLGYDKYTEKYYWPIPTDPNSRGTLKLDQNYEANIAAIKNQSHTKALTENATNAIMLGDIFNAYTRHISSMAAYSAYVVPISDFTRWYNSKGVKTEIQQLMGAKGTGYINTFLMALNGSALREEESGLSKASRAMARNAKTAAVGGNIRVVVQQPTSIARAAMYMDPKYLAKAMGKRAASADLVNRYCSIAQWKRWGFYETNIGPNLREMLIGDESVMDKVRNASMAPAGWGDNWTLNRLWNACELETKDMYPEMKPGTEEYYQQVGRRMSEIIDRTQVVDSVFHRSQIMRSKNWLNQTLTNFMSEPNKTYNMLMGSIANYAENRKNPAAKARVARAFGVWTATSVLTAAAASVVDTVRDGAGADEWLEKYLENLKENTVDALNPFGLLPGVKDVLSLLEGYDPSRLDQQSIQRIVWAAEAWQQYQEGKESAYGFIYKGAQAMSSLFGIPVSNVLRDANAVYKSVTGIDPTKTDEGNADAMIDQMNSAILSGNTQAAADYRAKLRDRAGLTPKEIDTGLAVLLTQEPDMARAYELMSKGKAREADAIRQKYIDMGYPAEAVDKAIKAHAPKQEKEVDPEAQLNVRLYKTDDMTNVMLMAAGVKAGEGVTMGDAMTIMSELVADSEAQDPNKAVKSSVQSSLKPEYVKLARAGDPRAQTLGSMMTQVLGTSEETMYGWVTDSYADDLRAGVDAYDPVVAKRAVAELRGRGLDDSSIKGKLTKYRQLYIDAVKSGDAQKAKDIKKMLMGLGLKGKNGKALYTNETFEDWLK